MCLVHRYDNEVILSEIWMWNYVTHTVYVSETLDPGDNFRAQSLAICLLDTREPDEDLYTHNIRGGYILTPCLY